MQNSNSISNSNCNSNQMYKITVHLHCAWLEVESPLSLQQYIVIAMGRKNFLYLCLLKQNCRSLSLNTLCWAVSRLCRVWDVLSIILRIFFRILLLTTTSSASRAVPSTELALMSFFSFLVATALMLLPQQMAEKKIALATIDW